MCMYIYGVSGVSAIRQSSVMLAKQAATHSDASKTTLSSKPLTGHHVCNMGIQMNRTRNQNKPPTTHRAMLLNLGVSFLV